MVNKLNKKGQDLSIGTLILIVLGIVVLVLLILGFSIGWENLWEKINIFGGTSSVSDVVTACNLALTSNDRFTLCQKSWEVNVNGQKQALYCRHTLVSPSLNDQVEGCTAQQDKALFASACAQMNGIVVSAPQTTCGTGKNPISIAITSEGDICCSK